jgi:hypothetical protein
MGEHVGVQIGFLVESLVARLERTTERFFTGMDPQMGFQVEV